MAPNPLVMTSKKCPTGAFISCRVIRWRLPETAQDHHAVAVAEASVAGRAIDVEAVLAALDIGIGDGDRKLIDIFARDFAGVARFVDAQLAARDGSFHFRTGGAMVGEKIAGGQGLVARLVLHVVAAGGQSDSSNRNEQPAMESLFLNFGHLFGIQFQEERPGFFAVEFRIVSLDAQKEAVDGSALGETS